jgi:hypothetical protein
MLLGLSMEGRYDERNAQNALKNEKYVKIMAELLSREDF